MEDDKEKESYKPTIPIIRTAPKPPRVPKDFGEYIVKEEVGCGGMGWIFKAVHKKLDVIHALKILHPTLSQHEEFLTNFKGEAQLAAKLQHPNIVTIHNTGEFAGFHYIAMEFIDGDNLAKKLPENGIDPPVVVLAIAMKILDALDHAHNYEFSYQGRPYYGLIHRDIKPENIIIDHHGEVKITDFGIAKGIHLYGDVTAEGMVVGTLSYMSPEQIDGVEKLSPTTDIYSLGVVIYELLSGKKAFVGNTTTQIIKRISNHEYEPLGRINRKIPPDIIKIVDKAMSYNSEERYQSAYEMRVEINRYLSQYQYNDPTTIIKKYFVERIPPSALRKEKRKKPSAFKPAAGKILKVLGVIVLVAVVFIALFYLNQKRIRHNAEKAISSLSGKLEKSKVNNAHIDFSDIFNLYESAQTEFASKNYGLTRSLCDSATGVLDQLLDSVKVEIRLKQAEVVDSTERAKNLGSSIDFTGLYLSPANILIGAEEFDQADSLLNVAFVDANKEIKRLTPRETHIPIPPPSPPEREVARSKLDDAYVQLTEAKKDCPNISFSAESTQIVQAEERFGNKLFGQSMQIAEEISKAIANKTATQCGIPEEIIQARKHYELFSEAQKENQSWNRQRMNELVREGKFDQAKVFAKEILKVKAASELVIPTTSPQSDSEYFNLATMYEEKGNFDLALENYQQVKPAGTLLDSRKYYLKARFAMGNIYHDRKRDYKKAIPEYQKVLELKYPNYYVACFLKIGECFYEIASYDSAIAYFEKVENYKSSIVPDTSRGQTSVFQSDSWHYTMYYWASALTKMCFKETNPQRKRRLRDDAIRKWENDYLDNFRKDINDPIRGPFVRNAEAERNSLKSGG